MQFTYKPQRRLSSFRNAIVAHDIEIVLDLLKCRMELREQIKKAGIRMVLFSGIKAS